MTPAERWAALSPERKAELRARWSQVKELGPEERARLRRVASRLRELERELVERGWKDKKLTDMKLGELAAFIESAADGPPLVPLATAK